MKIAFLNLYGGINNRGAETFVSEVAKRLEKRYQVAVFQGQDSLAFEKYRPGWRFYLDPQSLAIRRFTNEVLRNLDLETKIIIPVNGGWQSLLCRLWAWQHNAKVIISGQSGPGWDDRVNLLCRPDVFVAVTTYQADWAKRNSFGVRVVQIPNGVDLVTFNPKIKAAKINLPRPVFLCVAALELGKRIDSTIEAVAGLTKGSLLVIGSGALREPLEKLAAQLLPGRCQIISVPHNQIMPYYAACDATTMVPPRTESFGITLLEAMAVNKPVVTANDPPRREIVGNAGLFIDPEDTKAYTKNLQNVLTISWGDKPRKQAEKFSWDKIAKDYENLFKTL